MTNRNSSQTWLQFFGYTVCAKPDTHFSAPSNLRHKHIDPTANYRGSNDAIFIYACKLSVVFAQAILGIFCQPKYGPALLSECAKPVLDYQ